MVGGNPCLYFEIRPEGISYGFILWRPGPASMENFRRKIASEPEKFLEMIRQTEKATGMPITAETYKRPKSCENPALERFFGWKSAISCTVDLEFSPDTFGPALGQRAAAFLEKLIPLYEYMACAGK